MNLIFKIGIQKIEYEKVTADFKDEEKIKNIIGNSDKNTSRIE